MRSSRTCLQSVSRFALRNRAYVMAGLLSLYLQKAVADHLQLSAGTRTRVFFPSTSQGQTMGKEIWSPELPTASTFTVYPRQAAIL